MGIELEFYDAAAVRARFPFTRPAALFSKDGGQVDPHRLTHGLLAVGKRMGLEVYDRTEMTRLEETRHGVRVTAHNGCQITARRAVIAAGFESKGHANRPCFTPTSLQKISDRWPGSGNFNSRHKNADTS